MRKLAHKCASTRNNYFSQVKLKNQSSTDSMMAIPTISVAIPEIGVAIPTIGVAIDVPLQLSAWIAATESHLMTLADFAALPSGQPARIVPVDLSVLILEENGGRFPVPRLGMIYEPEEFFAHLSHSFMRFDSGGSLAIGAAPISPASHASGPRVSRRTPIGVLSDVLGVSPYVEIVSAAPAIGPEVLPQVSPRVSQIASMGAGDSCSRYMAWGKLTSLPPIYW